MLYYVFEHIIIPGSTDITEGLYQGLTIHPIMVSVEVDLPPIIKEVFEAVPYIVPEHQGQILGYLL